MRRKSHDDLSLAQAARRGVRCLFLALISTVTSDLAAQEPPKTGDDLQREAAIEQFTHTMKAANYPALFDEAAAEFHVPPDILKGVAFAETRWEQLTWPPGETASPETRMPRPYGIMSLWDNPYFGHSLLEAASLIGREPEELKTSVLQNMRGGAALLRKLYDANPRPDGTTEADIESWRYAIRKYCGIPEPDLNARHALKVYAFISQGYHQYGIEWDAHSVNLEPIREETARIVAEEQARRAANLRSIAATGTNKVSNAPTPLAAVTTHPAARADSVSNSDYRVQPQKQSSADQNASRTPLLWIGVFLALVAGSLLVRKFSTATRN